MPAAPTIGNIIAPPRFIVFVLLFVTGSVAGCAGIVFPGTAKPDMADFTYFAFTIGVAAQTADVSITSRHMRRVALMQSIAGFFFNLFVLALSINVLGAR